MASYVLGQNTPGSLEGLLLWTAQQLQIAEQNYNLPEGQPRQNRVNVAINTETNLVTITATLPVSVTTTDAGTIVVGATAYVPD